MQQIAEAVAPAIRSRSVARITSSRDPMRRRLWQHARMIARAAPRSLPLCLLAAAWLYPASAEAAPNPKLTDKRVRVHVGTDLFGFTHFNPDGSGDNVNVLGFGFGRQTGVDRGGDLLFFGIEPSVLSLGVGGVILDGRAVIGAQIAFTVDGVLPENGDNTVIMGGRGIPYFNWMFGPFGRWRPYIGLRFGLGGTYYHDEDGVTIVGGLITADTLHTIYPIVGAQAGAHAFLADSVSLDLGLTFDYAAPHARVDCEPIDCGDEDFEKTGDWLNLAMPYIGLSAWF
jgi:hypothetical protein